MNLQVIKDIMVRVISPLYAGKWEYCQIQDVKYNNGLKCWIIVYRLFGKIGPIPYEVRREKRFSRERLEEFVKYCEL